MRAPNNDGERQTQILLFYSKKIRDSKEVAVNEPRLEITVNTRYPGATKHMHIRLRWAANSPRLAAYDGTSSRGTPRISATMVND